MRRNRPVVFTLALVALVALSEIATRAYATFGSWSVRPIVMYMNPSNGDLPTQAVESAIQTAMGYWNAQSSGSLTYGGRVSDTTTANDGRSVIIFRNASDGGTLASTYAWSWNGDLVEADMVFWDGGFTFFTGTTGCSGGEYVEDVAAHELGHVLGLSHSDQPDATMYPSTGWCSQEWRSLSADDIAGLRSLYPSGSQTQLPAAPTAFGVGSATVSSLGLNWADNSNNESGFRIERSADGASFTPLTQVGSNVRSYTDSGLLAGTTYYYRVFAYNSAGSSAASNVGVGTTSSSISNTAPSVTINNPVGGASYPAGASITFSGTAVDSQDGTLTSALAWTSNLDGALGAGGSFVRSLSAGSHLITARATDSGGMSSSKQVTMTVTVSSGTALTLTARGTKVKGVPNVDLRWSGAATSTVDVYRNNVKVVGTANDGQQTDVVKKGAGSYAYKVCEAGSSTCSNTASVAF